MNELEKIYPVKTRNSSKGRTPWPYDPKGGDPNIFLPNWDRIKLLEQAFDYLENGTMSLRKATEWLIVETGKDLSHQGMRSLYLQYRPDSERLKTLRLKKELIKQKRLSREQRKEKNLTEKIRRARQAATIAQKKKERLEAVAEAPVLANGEMDFSSFVVPENREIVFRPNEGPQTEFLAASETQVLYGGSAGSGKSFALLADPIRYFDNKGFNGILLRRTNDELRELIWKSKELYKAIYPQANWSEKKSSWTFPSGAQLWMTYLERDDDVLRYQGQSFTWIGFDELTQYPTPFPWIYLYSRLRTTEPSLKGSLSMRACVDEGEVLTENGWKPIQNVLKGELVYSLTAEGSLVLRPVTQSVAYDVNEELVRIRKKNLYMSMTKDHRVLHKTDGQEQYRLTKWHEITSKSTSIARTSSSYNSTGWSHPLMTPEFLGLYIAEGSFGKPRKGNYKVIITQCKKANHKFVRETMEKLGFNVCYSNNGDFQITNKGLWTYVSQFGKAFNKHFPRSFLQEASYEQLKAAFDAYALGDGHWQSETSCTLATTSPQLKDDLCEIAIKLGYKVQFKETPSENPNHNTKYVVYVSLKGVNTKVDKNIYGRNDQSFESYKGKVYCLGVEETENFVLRQNGFVWVSGNTTNPGGPGHGWVKKMFVDPAVPGSSFPATDLETGEVLVYPANHAKAGQPLFHRRFIPALLYDNPYLANDGQYEANLLSLPEQQRRQLLEGDWNVADGAAFSEFREKDHVVTPFEIPSNWRRFRSCDFGYSSHSAVHWFAIDPSFETLYVYRELYASKMTARDLAFKVLELEKGENISYGVLDSSCWHQRGHMGPSIAEEMISVGCRWRPSDRTQGSRVAGKNRLHELLKLEDLGNGEKRPGIVFFNTCRQIVSDLPVIPADPSGTDDIDDRYASDHAYDSIRYGIMSRPKSKSPFEEWLTSRPVESYQPYDTIFGY